jgi:hypothetical protein
MQDKERDDHLDSPHGMLGGHWGSQTRFPAKKIIF